MRRNLGLKRLGDEIQRLNEDAWIYTKEDQQYGTTIFISVPATELVLPYGYRFEGDPRENSGIISNKSNEDIDCFYEFFVYEKRPREFFIPGNPMYHDIYQNGKKSFIQKLKGVFKKN